MSFGKGIGLIVLAYLWCAGAGSVPLAMELGESTAADGSHGTYLRVPNLPGDDTLQILGVAREAKCRNVAIEFEPGAYEFRFKQCERDRGADCDPYARPGDHQPQVWKFSVRTIVPNSAFVGWNELLGKVPACGDPIAGVQHNFLERKVQDLLLAERTIHGGRKLRGISSGDFMRPPPPSDADLPTSSPGDLQILAQWWSRFGTPWLREHGTCAIYEPCDPQPCKNASGRPIGRFGPVDYTWEWNHVTGARVGPGLAKCGRLVRTERNTGLTVDYPLPYQPKRHPLLGWYRDTDPVALDWIAYWLRTHGVDAVIINDEKSLDYHVETYSSVLFSQAVPNFSALRFVKWMPVHVGQNSKILPESCAHSFESRPGKSGCYADPLYEQWERRIRETYLSEAHRQRAFLVTKIGSDGKRKRYPLVAVWQGDTLRRNLATAAVRCSELDGAQPHASRCLRACGRNDPNSGQCGLYETRLFFERVARLFQEHGYDGVALVVQNLRPRNWPWKEFYSRPDLESAGVLYIDGTYTGTEYNIVSPNSVSRGNYDQFRSYVVSQYSEYVKANSLITVPTDLDKRQPHPASTKAIPGSTPQGFRCWLDALANQLTLRYASQQQLPWENPAIAIYNVSEWLEGGASLQPNMRDRFGYLSAARAIKLKYQRRKGRIPGVASECLPTSWEVGSHALPVGWPWGFEFRAAENRFVDLYYRP